LMRSGRHLLIPLIGHAIGLDAATIGLIFSISAAIDMLLFYPVGAAMDRFGRKSVGVPCMTLFAIGLALLSYADSFATLLGISLLLGLANGLGSGIILTLGSDFAPRQRRSEFLGVWRLIGDAGNASAPIMIGGLVSAATLSAAALAIAAIGLSGALVLAFLVEETLRRPGDS
jgi:MFS family permease